MKKLAEEKKRNEDKERRKFKEINLSLVVRTTKFPSSVYSVKYLHLDYSML